MKIELETQDIQNLLFALNSVEVRGQAQMITVLRLMEKLNKELEPVVVGPGPETGE